MIFWWIGSQSIGHHLHPQSVIASDGLWERFRAIFKSSVKFWAHLFQWPASLVVMALYTTLNIHTSYFTSRVSHPCQYPDANEWQHLYSVFQVLWKGTTGTWWIKNIFPVLDFYPSPFQKNLWSFYGFKAVFEQKEKCLLRLKQRKVGSWSTLITNG